MDREKLTVGFFRPEDAEGIAKLFTEIYGDSYPAKIVYNPDPNRCPFMAGKLAGRQAVKQHK